MASAGTNRPWNLESFLDSLIMELDRARETLAIKAVNRPLTYSVKDLSLELQLFPSYDGGQVKFVTAKPGEQGASKVSIQLGSITDRQIRESAPLPISRDDIAIEEMEDLDESDRQSLKKLGVKSVKDIQKLEERNVDLEKASNNRIKFTKLARLIERSRRNKYQPTVKSISMMEGKAENLIYLEGDNLMLDAAFEPQAMLNGLPVIIKKADKNRVVLSLARKMMPFTATPLEVMLDADTVVKINLKT